jgi:hypothetical protein
MELAILAMTNAPFGDNYPELGSAVVLTTKDAYLWAAAFAVIVERDQVRKIDEDSLTRACR